MGKRKSPFKGMNMQEESGFKSTAEIIIFLVLGYFINESHGWALAVSVSLIGILLLTALRIGRDIINRLSIIYDRQGK
ncbi:MAG: hypothetical protein V7731_16190 [Amphritea sp.]